MDGSIRIVRGANARGVNTLGAHALGAVARGAVALTWLLCLASCGGGNSGGGGPGLGPVGPPPPAANVVPAYVDGGPSASSGSVNTLFTSVTVCAPGSTTACQTIDHIQVDTGSFGLRLLAPALSVALPLSQAPDGNTLLECTQFVDGYSWGPVAMADIQVGGELAPAVPVQVIGDPTFSAVPAACSGTGPPENTVAAFGANGILGIGVFEQDCGGGCVSDPTVGDYYACTSSGNCVGTVAPLNIQVQNPVAHFAVDNNGTLIDLPPVAAPGEPTLTGSLIFGIDTQGNNASGSVSVITVDLNHGEFTTVYNGNSLPASFIDSGTNGIYFNDSNIQQCTDAGFTTFYCPATTQDLSGSIIGQNGVSVLIGFSIGNAQTLSAGNPTFSVLPQLGGTYSSSMQTFDWGLPFYYGRRVATALENHATALASGPYIAF